MKVRFLLTSLAALLALLPCTRAADPAPEAPAAQPESVTETKLKQLIERITAKLEAGQHLEEDFTAELAEFATLAAGATPDTAAMVLLMKARLYLEIFQDPAQGVVVLKQIAADYPTAGIATKVGSAIEAIDARLAAQAALAVGNVFPPLGEADLEGKPLDLSAYAGKVVLVDFWATWCKPCVAELPNVAAAYRKYHAKGFEILGISLDEDRGTLLNFIKENNMTWRQYFDGLRWENKIATRFGIDGIPATFLLDRSGRIVARDLRGDELDKKLAALLATK